MEVGIPENYIEINNDDFYEFLKMVDYRRMGWCGGIEYQFYPSDNTFAVVENNSKVWFDPKYLNDED